MKLYSGLKYFVNLLSVQSDWKMNTLAPRIELQSFLSMAVFLGVFTSYVSDPHD